MEIGNFNLHMSLLSTIFFLSQNFMEYLKYLYKGIILIV